MADYEDENVVPPYLNPGEIARASGISRKRVMTLLAPRGQFENGTTNLLTKNGARFWVSAGDLMTRWPELYQRVWGFYARKKGVI